MPQHQQLPPLPPLAELVTPPPLDPALAPENAARTVKRSRLAELAAHVALVLTASTCIATCTSSVAHDYAAVRIAEARAAEAQARAAEARVRVEAGHAP